MLYRKLAPILLAAIACVMPYTPAFSMPVTTTNSQDWKKILPLVMAVAVLPGSESEGSWSTTSAPSNAGAGEHPASAYTSIIQFVGVERDPFNGIKIFKFVAGHASGMIKVGFRLDGGTIVYNTTPVDGPDKSVFVDDVSSRWEQMVYEVSVNTADIDFTDGPIRRLQLEAITYAIDGQNRVFTVILEAHENTVAPSETKYVALTTNSPDDDNPGTYEEPWATLDYALDQIADGGRIELIDAGDYYQGSRGSFRDNERFIVVTTSLPTVTQTITVNGVDQDIEVPQVSFSGVTTPRIGRLWYEGVTRNCTSGDFIAYIGGEVCKIVQKNCFWTGAGRQLNATEPYINQVRPIALGGGDSWWFIGTRCYDTVWGLFSQNAHMIDCIISKISFVPWGYGVPLNYNTKLDDFNSNDWLPDPTTSPFPFGANAGYEGDPTALGYRGTTVGGYGTSETDITVTSTSSTASGFPLPGASGSLEGYPYFMKWGSTEYIRVNGRTGTVLHTTRGYNVTGQFVGASSHSDGEGIWSIGAIPHPDVIHDLNGMDNYCTYALRLGTNVNATMFRLEILAGGGIRQNLLYANCELRNVYPTSVVHSDINGINNHTVFWNVWNPHNPWDFVYPFAGSGRPDFVGSAVYFIKCGLHYLNALPWLVGVTHLSALPPSGVYVQDCYEPPEGLQTDTCPLTAADETTGIRFTWTASGWSSRDHTSLFIYNAATLELVVEAIYQSASGNFLFTDAQYGVEYIALTYEYNDGSGEIKYGQTAVETHLAPPAIGVDGEGFSQKLIIPPGATAGMTCTWTPTQSKTIVITVYDGEDEVASYPAVFESGGS